MLSSTFRFTTINRWSETNRPPRESSFRWTPAGSTVSDLMNHYDSLLHTLDWTLYGIATLTQRYQLCFADSLGWSGIGRDTWAAFCRMSASIFAISRWSSIPHFSPMAPTLFDSLQIALSISDFLELCEGGWICSLHWYRFLQTKEWCTVVHDYQVFCIPVWWVSILGGIIARVTMISIMSMGSAHICCYPLLNHIGCSLHGCNGMTETFTFQLYRVH